MAFGSYSMDGGNLRNAIAREAFSEFCIPEIMPLLLPVLSVHLLGIVQSELKTADPGVEIAF
jgi:hypothetical protein